MCTPARHFSGRLFTRNTTLWASWVIAGPRHRAFFGGDTGYTKSFAEIGADHGPFDLTLLPIGAYHPAWPDIHMNPEDAVRAHLDVAEAGSGLLVPIHWATFRLAPHPWAEPVERLLGPPTRRACTSWCPGRDSVSIPRRPGRSTRGGSSILAERTVSDVITLRSVYNNRAFDGLTFTHELTGQGCRCRGAPDAGADSGLRGETG